MNKLMRIYYEGRLSGVNRELSSTSQTYGNYYRFITNPSNSVPLSVADRAGEIIFEHDCLLEKRNRLTAKLNGRRTK